MMLTTIAKPTTEQILLYKAVNRELEKRTKDSLSDEERNIIVSRFVDSYDFSNVALQHKSASGWAKMLISEII